jgi:hypothetical protein
MKALDVIVSGRMGLYSIDPLTVRGCKWMKRHLSKGERTPTSNGGVYCEGGNRCRDIVEGMDRDGLRVEVNGVDMNGFSKTGVSP